MSDILTVRLCRKMYFLRGKTYKHTQNRAKLQAKTELQKDILKMLVLIKIRTETHYLYEACK